MRRQRIRPVPTANAITWPVRDWLGVRLQGGAFMNVM